MRDMTDAERQELIDAGITPDEMQAFIDDLTFSVVLADADVQPPALALADRMSAEKGALLFRILKAMQAG